MTKEKVNTHFSFPLTLDMAPYLEKNLLNITEAHDEQLQIDEPDESKSTKYELIGVTVHTGTADGGHYYSFIQDRDPQSATRNKWFLFNDAEVKPFDKGQLAAECFGGETTSKQYDQVHSHVAQYMFLLAQFHHFPFYRPMTNSSIAVLKRPILRTCFFMKESKILRAAQKLKRKLTPRLFFSNRLTRFPSHSWIGFGKITFHFCATSLSLSTITLTLSGKCALTYRKL